MRAWKILRGLENPQVLLKKSLFYWHIAIEAFSIEHCKPINIFGLQLQMLNDSDSMQVLK